MSQAKANLRQKKSENQKDLAVFAKRAKELTVSYEDVLKKLKVNVTKIKKIIY